MHRRLRLTPCPSHLSQSRTMRFRLHWLLYWVHRINLPTPIKRFSDRTPTSVRSVPSSSCLQSKDWLQMLPALMLILKSALPPLFSSYYPPLFSTAILYLARLFSHHDT